MRTCVCYLEIQRSRGKEGNARFANEGHLRFVSVAFGLWTLEGKVRERAFFHFLKLSQFVTAFEVHVRVTAVVEVQPS